MIRFRPFFRALNAPLLAVAKFINLVVVEELETSDQLPSLAMSDPSLAQMIFLSPVAVSLLPTQSSPSFL